MEQQYDFTIIEQAGLTQKEFGELCGVSRVTVNLWAGKKMRPHRYIRERVVDVVDRLRQALAENRLPIADTIARSDREAAINAALAKNAAEA